MTISMEDDELRIRYNLLHLCGYHEAFTKQENCSGFNSLKLTVLCKPLQDNSGIHRI
jgi:hypothetical protein